MRSLIAICTRPFVNHISPAWNQGVIQLHTLFLVLHRLSECSTHLHFPIPCLIVAYPNVKANRTQKWQCGSMKNKWMGNPSPRSSTKLMSMWNTSPINLGENVYTKLDLCIALRDATALVVMLPHQFLHKLPEQIKNALWSRQEGVCVVTLSKGVNMQGTNIQSFAMVIQNKLDVPCSALSGANIADKGTSDTVF